MTCFNSITVLFNPKNENHLKRKTQINSSIEKVPNNLPNPTLVGNNKNNTAKIFHMSVNYNPTDDFQLTNKASVDSQGSSNPKRLKNKKN